MKNIKKKAKKYYIKAVCSGGENLVDFQVSFSYNFYN